MTKLTTRIKRFITDQPTHELQLKRNARFGKLNIDRQFKLAEHIAEIEGRGDVRRQFAKLASSPKHRRAFGTKF